MFTRALLLHDRFANPQSQTRNLVSSFSRFNLSWPAGAREGSVQLRFPQAQLPGARHAGQQNSSSLLPLLLLLFVGRLRTLPRKHLDHSVAATADNPAAILAPDDRADAFAAHDAVAGNLLSA